MYTFVYGTLKRNCPNNYVLTDPTNGTATFISDGQTIDKFPMVVTTDFLIPYLLDKKGTGKQIFGEVYKVDEQMSSFLNTFERIPTIYSRTQEQIKLIPSGQIVTANIYVFHNFLPHFLNETFHENYTCHNFEVLRSLSAKKLPDLRRQIRLHMRGEKYYENRDVDD